MFDLGDFLRHYVAPDEEAAEIAETGVCIASKPLGAQIFELLLQPSTPRTLHIVLPAAANDEVSGLIANLARVPRESARPQLGAATLAQKNLLIQLQHEVLAKAQVLPLAKGAPLYVLFVFAQAHGSQPLGMRRERREMMQIFQREVYPQRQVIAHTLAHGVTRASLRARPLENGGYHIIHWSDHGGPDVLELTTNVDERADENADELPCISGSELVALLQEAGGYLPHLFFLSACNSGAVQTIENWQHFAAAVQMQVQGGGGLPHDTELFAEQNDIVQAIVQECRALALFDDLSDPAERAAARNNLASYLNRSTTPAALAEAQWHRLADLAYCIGSGLQHDLQTSLRNYARVFYQAMAVNTGANIPRLAELLARPEFDSLSRWLQQRAIVPETLQVEIDDLLVQVRLQVLAEDEAVAEGEA